MRSSPGQVVKLEDIPKLDLTPSHKEICMKIVKICRHFFTRGHDPGRMPFRGILLYGPPSTGKTEIARQTARLLGGILKGHCEVHLVILDSADIASPKWGEAEGKLRAIFNSKEIDGKVLLFFDDIDCLMMERGSRLSKEWHFSIDSIIFHELDRINPTNMIVLATTNRPDLVDEALKSRFYEIEVPTPPKEELMEIAEDMLNGMYAKPETVSAVKEIVRERLKQEDLSIRDIQHIVMVECIERGF